MSSDLALSGRRAELDRVLQSIRAVETGAGRAVMITGESGIGKSRLLREAARDAAGRGLLVMRGRASETGGAYQPVVEAFARPAALLASDPALEGLRPILARVLPGWSSSAEPAAEPMADPSAVLAQALLMLLPRLSPAGSVLILDDLQWADRNSLSTIASLVDSVITMPLTVVLAARAEPALAVGLLRLVEDGSVEEIALRRLSASEVRATLAATQPDLGEKQTDELVRLVDGLPLVLDELTRATENGTTDAHDQSADARHSWQPGSALQSSVQRKLAVVSADTRRLLDALAVIGDADVDVVLTASRLSASALRDAVREGIEAGILTVGETPLGVTWRHHLIGEVLRRQVLALEVRATARRAAEVLIDHAAPTDGRLSQAARMFELAGCPQQAARQLVQAARIAVHRSALDAAEEYLAEAQRLGEGWSSSVREVLVERIDTLVLSGRALDGHRAGVEALDGVPQSADRPLLLATARAAFVGGAPGAGRELLARLESESAGTEPDAAHVLLRARSMLTDRLLDAGEPAVRAADLALQEGRTALACEALVVAAVAGRRHGSDRPVALLERAGELARTHGHPLWQVRSLAERGVLDMINSSDPRRLEQAHAAATAGGMLGTAAEVDVRIGQTVAARSGFRAARPIFVRTVVSSRKLGLTAVHAHASELSTECRLLSGRDTDGTENPAPLSEVMAETLALVDSTETVPYVGASVGVAAWMDGRDAEAVGVIEDALATVRHEAQMVPWWGLAALLRVLAGAEPAASFGPARLWGHHANHAAHSYAVAVAQARVGLDPRSALDEAERLIGEAIFLRHLLRTAAAPDLHRAGVDCAEGWLREADAFCGLHEEWGLQRRVRRSISEVGLKQQRRRTGAVPVRLAGLGVTGRETEILRLINSGLSNPEIARQLVISVRTVETHVGSLLVKCGCHRRDELPRIDLRQP